MPDSFFTVHVEDTDIQWRCRHGQSIAQGADRAQQGHLLAGCRGGGCGVCKVQLVAGQVSLRPHGSNTLTPKEKSDGMVLACCAEPRSDVRIRIIQRPTFPSNLSSPRR